jgi:hypothetical protein
VVSLNKDTWFVAHNLADGDRHSGMLCPLIKSAPRGSRRRSTFLTVKTCHRPPREVGTPRTFSAVVDRPCLNPADEMPVASWSGQLERRGMVVATTGMRIRMRPSTPSGGTVIAFSYSPIRPTTPSRRYWKAARIVSKLSPGEL